MYRLVRDPRAKDARANSAPVEPEPVEVKTVALREAAGATVDSDDANWRPLTGADTRRRDLSPLDQRRMQELAAYQWESNRLTNRLIELPVAFMFGEGVTVTVEDPEAQSWLDDFWVDPINRLDLNLEKHARELSLFGEQCWPVFVDELSGRVHLGKVDPAAIIGVVTDPENVAVPIGVVVQKESGRKKVYRVIYDGDDADLFGVGARKIRAGMTAGDCFYWRVNDLSNGRRGRSDILSAIDHADVYEQLLYGEAERAVVLRTIFWDVTLKNATPDEVAEKARSIQPPGPRDVRVHNENETWSIETPSLNAADASESLRVVRNHVLGGGTIPEHWFGGGGDVNLATASSMGEPTYKVFSQRQRLWKAILEALAKFVIRQRLLAISSELLGLAGTPPYQPVVIFPELTARDTSKYTTALQQAVVAGTQGVAGGVMSEETAVKLIALVAGQLGLEIDPVEELKAARADAARRSEADIYRDPPGLTGEQLPPASETAAMG